MHNVDKCNRCAEFPCEKISSMLERSKEYQKRCKEVCSDAEYEMLEKAIFYKKGVTDPDYCVLKFTSQNGRYYCDLKTESFVLEI